MFTIYLYVQYMLLSNVDLYFFVLKYVEVHIDFCRPLAAITVKCCGTPRIVPSSGADNISQTMSSNGEIHANNYF